MTPLKAFPAFEAGSPERLSEKVATMLGARVERMGASDRGLGAQANYSHLAQTELWFCSYGIPITLSFPEGDFLRVQFAMHGAGQTRIGSRAVAVTGQEGCVSSAAAAIDFGADFRQVVWRMPRPLLVSKLAALTGRPVTAPLAFSDGYDLSRPLARNVVNILGTILHTLETWPQMSAGPLVGELEQAMLTAFLGSAPHNARHLLEAPSPAAAPWQVHKAEEYMEAHWDQAVRIEDLVEVTGTSARSLFRTFKEHRGYSPLDFARRLRLQNARRQLAAVDGPASVTEVALACAWSDMGRFSKDFAAAFGETPSAVLRRRKAGQAS